MAFENTVRKADWTKVFLVEMEPAVRLDLEYWWQDPVYTNCWYRKHEPEVSRVKVSGDTYEEAVNLPDLNSMSGGEGWFWDKDTQRLYLHMANGDDPMSESGYYYFVTVFHWEYYTNIQDEDEPVLYYGKYYLPYLRSEELPDIEQGVTDYYEGGVSLGFGDIILINADGYWDARLSTYAYEWKQMKLRVGDLGATSGDVITLWQGVMADIDWSDEEVKFEILDPREM